MPPVPLSTLVGSSGPAGSSGPPGSNGAFGSPDGTAMYYSYGGKNYATMDEVNLAITAATGLPSGNGINQAFAAAAGMPLVAGDYKVGSDDEAVRAASGISSAVAEEKQLHHNDEATVKQSTNGQDGEGQVFN